MRAIVLAAGMGTRLGMLTDKRPKCMVRVLGKPIIQWQIEAYLYAGLSENEIFIVTGYLSARVEELLNREYPAVNVVRNELYDQTNNMYSLNLALQAVSQGTDCLMISNGDCVYDLSLVRGLKEDSREDLIAVDAGEYLEESMKIVVREGRVVTISKVIPPGEAYGSSIDLYKLSAQGMTGLRKIIDDYLKKDKNSWTEVALDMLLSEHALYPFDIKSGRWVEIDNLEDLLLAERVFSRMDPADKKAFVLDLDGTVYVGNTPIEGAVAFINARAGDYEFFYMTNNTSRSRQSYLDKLRSMGIKEVSEENILTPVASLARHLTENEMTAVYCVGTEALKQELNKAHIDVVEDIREGAIAAVVLGYDTEITYQKIRDAGLLLAREDVGYFATHMDRVCPTEEGPVPDVGSFMELFKCSNGRTPDRVFGKPQREMLLPVLEKYAEKELVIVGDRLYTDMALAHQAKIDFILVLSGETSRRDVEEVDRFPCLILNELGDLHE